MNSVTKFSMRSVHCSATFSPFHGETKQPFFFLLVVLVMPLLHSAVVFLFLPFVLLHTGHHFQKTVHLHHPHFVHSTAAETGTQVVFVSVAFDDLDAGAGGVTKLVAPTALVKHIGAATVADDAHFGVLNVPVHHHLLQKTATIVLLHCVQQQCRSGSIHESVTGQGPLLHRIVGLLFRVPGEP